MLRLRSLGITVALSLTLSACASGGAEGGPGVYSVNASGLETQIEIPVEPNDFANEYLSYAERWGIDVEVTWLRVIALNTSEESRFVCEVTILDDNGTRYDAVDLYELINTGRDSLSFHTTDSYNEGIRLSNQQIDIKTTGGILPGEKREFILAVEAAQVVPSAVFSGEGFGCDERATKVG